MEDLSQMLRKTCCGEKFPVEVATWPVVDVFWQRLGEHPSEMLYICVVLPWAGGRGEILHPESYITKAFWGICSGAGASPGQTDPWQDMSCWHTGV